MRQIFKANDVALFCFEEKSCFVFRPHQAFDLIAEDPWNRCKTFSDCSYSQALNHSRAGVSGEHGQLIRITKGESQPAHITMRALPPDLQRLQNHWQMFRALRLLFQARSAVETISLLRNLHRRDILRAIFETPLGDNRKNIEHFIISTISIPLNAFALRRVNTRVFPTASCYASFSYLGNWRLCAFAGRYCLNVQNRIQISFSTRKDTFLFVSLHNLNKIRNHGLHNLI